MAYTTQTRQIRFAGFDGPPPRDLIVLLAVVFVTYSAQFFTSILEWLRLSAAAWQSLLLWQPLTCPWIGLAGGGTMGGPRPSVWILLELFILYMFAVEVFRSLGRRRFWRLLVLATLSAALAALLVDGVTRLVGAAPFTAFSLMQGQRMLIAVIIAAFATLRSNATILLFFVLPIRAAWFLWLEIAVAFIGFLGSKDIAGFVGVCVAVGATVWLVRHPTLRGGLRELRLRTEQRVLQRRLERMRRRSRLKVVRGEGGRGTGGDRRDGGGSPWIN